MSDPLFRTDPYLKSASATVVAITEEGGIILDRSLFYPTGGGQPGDTGRIVWGGHDIVITDTQKGHGDAIVLIPEEGAALPTAGATIETQLDWERRLRHMRIHTALHLLSVVIPLPVTGGAITAEKGRLDFNMDTPPEDKDALSDALNQLIEEDHEITEDWITEEELDANPGLVKTMSVKPPRGAGKIRLIRIGSGKNTVDLQPCGGTHVARTSEIGRVRLGKIEKKGKQNRRVALHLVED